MFDKQKEKGLTGTVGERVSTRRGTLHLDRERENMMDVDDVDGRGKNRKYVNFFFFFFPSCT